MKFSGIICLNECKGKHQRNEHELSGTALQFTF